MTTPTSEALAPGTSINQTLTVVRQLGAGGMGDVYLAHDTVLDRQVAVKVMRDGLDVDDAAQRTLDEARAAARVVHPNVVGIFAAGHWQGRTYIEMQYVSGPSLRERLDMGPLPRAQAGLWLAQLAAALDAAHEIGVLHCDVKPDNVLLHRDPSSDEHAKLVDFGLARPARDAAVQGKVTHGTVAYLAPELARDPPHVGSDVFALAVVAHELLTGRLPARGTWLQGAHPTRPLTGFAELPDAATQLLAAGLDAAAELRPPSAGALADGLLRALHLPQLRHGTAQRQSDQAQTTLRMALPLTGLAESPQHMTQLVLGMVAAVPAGYPRAAALAIGGGVADAVIDQLQRDGLLIGPADHLELGPRADKDAILRALPNKWLRMVLTRVAAAVEVTGPRGEAAREDASRLYLAGNRMEDAARLATESAAAARAAGTRRQHLARAAAFVATPAKPIPWLTALLQLLRWDVACGNVVDAGPPLADAQGLIVDAGMGDDNLGRVALELLTAQIRLLAGDAQTALALAERLLARPRLAVATQLGAQAVVIGALVAEGQAIAGANLGRKWLHVGDERMAAAAFAVTVADAALAAGDVNLADHASRLAIAAATDSGQALAAVSALAVAARVALHRDMPARGLQSATQALALVQPLGVVAAAAEALAVSGQCQLRLGRPVQAVLALVRADQILGALGLVAQRCQVLTDLAQAVADSGDADAAVAVRAQRDALVSRRRSLPGQPTSAGTLPKLPTLLG